MKLIDTFRKNESRDREKILKRRVVIESRKEMLERVNMEKDEAELAKEREKEKKLRKAEEERLKREAEERERQRQAQERENIRKKEAEKRIEQLKQTDVGMRALEGLTEEVTTVLYSRIVLIFQKVTSNCVSMWGPCLAARFHRFPFMQEQLQVFEPHNPVRIMGSSNTDTNTCGFLLHSSGVSLSYTKVLFLCNIGA